MLVNFFSLTSPLIGSHGGFDLFQDRIQRGMLGSKERLQRVIGVGVLLLFPILAVCPVSLLVVITLVSALF